MSVEALIAWVAERESIRKAKEAGFPPPWSTDPIFQTYRFTNVRRKDDRVSRWLRQHVLTEANLAVDVHQFIMFAAFCRWCNWPPTIAEIMRRGLFPSPNIDWKKIVDIFTEFNLEKKKAFTSAYMIPARMVQKGQTKAWSVIQYPIICGVGGVLPELESALRTHQRREVWLVLKSIRNWGSFLSGQVVDDLGWTPLLAGAIDTNTWAPIGPGSLRGFNRVLGLPLRIRHTEEEWCTNLQAWRNEIIAQLGEEFLDLDLHSTQSCLCEFDKYERVRLDQGRPRSRYKPETAYFI